MNGTKRGINRLFQHPARTRIFMLAVTVVFIRWRVASDRRMRRSWRMVGARVEATADRGSNDPGQNLYKGGGMRRILAVSLMLVALPGLVAPALAQAGQVLGQEPWEVL